MLKIKEIQTKSIITKSRLPGADFVINPYIGCSHNCSYCYASFMKKFSGHTTEKRGEFVDIKLNASETLGNLEKYKNKSIVIGSVTDAYQPIEIKYKITRKILEKLQNIDANINIITKSDLILRDLDLLKKFKNLEIAISFSSLNEDFKKILEPGTKSIKSKIKTLQILQDNNIKTVSFISPILPYITEISSLIKTLSPYSGEFRFENLNLYGGVKKEVYEKITEINPKLIEKYDLIYKKKNDFWKKMQIKIVNFCGKNKIKYKIFFHHKK